MEGKGQGGAQHRMGKESFDTRSQGACPRPHLRKVESGIGQTGRGTGRSGRSRKATMVAQGLAKRRMPRRDSVCQGSVVGPGGWARPRIPPQLLGREVAFVLQAPRPLHCGTPGQLCGFTGGLIALPFQFVTQSLDLSGLPDHETASVRAQHQRLVPHSPPSYA